MKNAAVSLIRRHESLEGTKVGGAQTRTIRESEGEAKDNKAPRFCEAFVCVSSVRRAT